MLYGKGAVPTFGGQTTTAANWETLHEMRDRTEKRSETTAKRQIVKEKQTNKQKDGERKNKRPHLGCECRSNQRNKVSFEHTERHI